MYFCQLLFSLEFILSSVKTFLSTLFLGEARRDIHEMLNIYNGTVIGFEDTVIVKIPMIANPSPVAKKVSWLDLDNQAINVKTVVLQPGNVSYRHLIISIVPWNGVEQNRAYTVNYGGRLLTKITIDSKGNEADDAVI